MIVELHGNDGEVIRAALVAHEAWMQPCKARAPGAELTYTDFMVDTHEADTRAVLLAKLTTDPVELSTIDRATILMALAWFRDDVVRRGFALDIDALHDLVERLNGDPTSLVFALKDLTP